MSYIHCTLHYRQSVTVGDSIDAWGVSLFTDADHANDKTDRISATGVFMALVGENTYFPIQAVCRKQTCQSHSTPESEIVALDHGVLKEAIPALMLLDVIARRPMHCQCREDNGTCIRVVDVGYSEALRHLDRVQGIDIGFLHAVFADKLPKLKGQFSILHCPTNEQAADVFTKGITDTVKFTKARELIGIVPPRVNETLPPAACPLTCGPSGAWVPPGGTSTV